MKNEKEYDSREASRAALAVTLTLSLHLLQHHGSLMSAAMVFIVGLWIDDCYLSHRHW
jgi:hypothetical protein